MSLYCILRCLNKKRECKTLPKAKYDIIYHDLKQKIEDETYAYQDLLPSEHLLVQTYDCSRNTVRRALAELTAEGYVQPMHGKGVRNIFQPVDQAAFTVGGIKRFHLQRYFIFLNYPPTKKSLKRPVSLSAPNCTTFNVCVTWMEFRSFWITIISAWSR